MESLHLKVHVPASCAQIFDAWIHPERHATMTGGGATGGSAPGSAFTAWDGYISGVFRELDRPGRIAMDWRTAEFPANAPHSKVVIRLTPAAGGTSLDLEHTDIPDGQADRYREGWAHFYFEPMKKHFGG